ncbi:MAG: hypothetical protein EA379_07800 [Phycisphaerales bacterium]|nr:MAG: hypothetical protein EA379_07800 [Phycisphaerales bacterium]
MQQPPQQPPHDAPLPLIAGDVTADVVGVAPVSIHSDLYYDLTLRVDPASDRGLLLRVPSHACPRPPTPGDRVRLGLLMGQVSSLQYVG